MSLDRDAAMGRHPAGKQIPRHGSEVVEAMVDRVAAAHRNGEEYVRLTRWEATLAYEYVNGLRDNITQLGRRYAAVSDAIDRVQMLTLNHIETGTLIDPVAVRAAITENPL